MASGSARSSQRRSLSAEFFNGPRSSFFKPDSPCHSKRRVFLHRLLLTFRFRHALLRGDRGARLAARRRSRVESRWMNLGTGRRASRNLVASLGIAVMALSAVALAQLPLSFYPYTDYELTESEPRDVVVGDFNQDGHLDLAVALSGNSEDPVGDMNVMWGDGAGGFSDLTSFSTGPQAWGSAAADFNGDGRLDLAVAEGAQTAPRTAVWLGTATGGFTLATALPGGSFPIAVATGDFNGDGTIDIATAHNVSGGIVVYSGDGAGGFGQGAAVPSSGSNATDLLAADLNGDGQVDLVMAHYSGISFFAGSGAGTFAYSGGVAHPNLVEAVAVGDVNGDGALDLASAEIYTGATTVYVNNGTGGFTQSHRVTTGTTLRDVVLHDLNRDELDDVVTVNQDQHTLSVMLSEGDGTFTAAQYFATGIQPAAGAAGDWNEDGFADLAAPYRNYGDAPWTSTLLQVPAVLDDSEAPSVSITGPAQGSVVANTVALNAAADDNVGVVRVAFFDGAIPVGQSASPFLVSWNTTLASPGVHTLTARAYDAAGNVGQSEPIEVTVEGDTTAPSPPGGLRTTKVTRTAVALAWNASMDDVGVTGYKLYELVRIRRFVWRWVLRQDNIGGLGTIVTGLAANSQHTYAAAATDAAGNISAKSAPLAITTLP
jgi:hypothetical protein